MCPSPIQSSLVPLSLLSLFSPSPHSLFLSLRQSFAVSVSLHLSSFLSFHLIPIPISYHLSPSHSLSHSPFLSLSLSASLSLISSLPTHFWRRGERDQFFRTPRHFDVGVATSDRRDAKFASKVEATQSTTSGTGIDASSQMLQARGQNILYKNTYRNLYVIIYQDVSSIKNQINRVCIQSSITHF